MANKLKIKGIRSKGKDIVYDIHHKIREDCFLEEHPNIIANNVVISNCGRHAGGVIISDNVYDNMPVKRSKGVMQTPWTEGVNSHQLEPLGFLKFDILAVGTLRIIEETIRKIISTETGQVEEKIDFAQVKKWFYEKLHPDSNQMDDQKVFEYVYHKGNWGGVFQFAQAPVRAFAQALKPRTIDDISATTSIYRPGPLKAGVDKLFLANREHPEVVKYRHPFLKEILANEAGCIAAGELIKTKDGELSIETVVEKSKTELIEVLSFDETAKQVVFDAVVAGIKTGEKKTITLSFDDATTLELTEDHLVYTLNGYKQASQLTEADSIVSF